MIERDIVVVADPAALATQGAIEFQTRSHVAIKDHGWFAVALSGGTTPKAMFELLTGTDFAEDIRWDAVHLFWGDERCVPPDDPRSNYGMARAALIDKVSIPPENVHRMCGEDEPHEAAVAYDEELARFFEGPARFDLVYLGLGPDGHTASLFPDTTALGVMDRECVANLVGEKVASPWRLTLTYPPLNASRAVIFLVDGPGKADIVAQVLEGPSDPKRLPSQGIIPAGDLVWLLDRAAASKLRSTTSAPRGA
ncbi:MAG TPA: 6-phosphogluconolactonase [Candidatus Acidoferrales bacterium]|nr:6-phosphogluconolactonase [Candidatus Acidoferrales bacterium]